MADPFYFSLTKIHILRASSLSLRLVHAQGKTTLSYFLTLSRRFATRSARQMRTPRLAPLAAARAFVSHEPPQNEKSTHSGASFCGDSWENRTPVSALRGPCLSRLTNEPIINRLIILPQFFQFVNRF